MMKYWLVGALIALTITTNATAIETPIDPFETCTPGAAGCPTPTPTPTPNGGTNLLNIPVDLLEDWTGGECQDCPEDNFTEEFFLDHAKQEFSEKFPFDAIEITATGGSGQCITFQGEDYCQIKTALGKFLDFIKFPIWITFLLGLIKAV